MEFKKTADVLDSGGSHTFTFKSDSGDELTLKTANHEAPDSLELLDSAVEPPKSKPQPKSEPKPPLFEDDKEIT